MKKQFYEEPEIEVMRFSLIKTTSGGLDIEDAIPEDDVIVGSDFTGGDLF